MSSNITGGGKLIVNVPYDNEYGDIHKQNFLLTFFTFFANEGIPYNYKKERMIHSRGNWDNDEDYKKFTKMRMELVIPKGIFFYNYLMAPFINWLIKISPAYYEQTPLKALFPANEIKIVYTK